MNLRIVRKLLSLTTLAALVAAFAASPLLAAEVTVSAAASLTNAFKELQPAFEKAHPGVTLVFNFGASGALLRQMEEGAPVDVFASADEFTMDKAVAKNLMDTASRVDFAANSLVMAVPAASTLDLKSPSDLTGPKVEKIAIGSPASVPAGHYAQESLAKAGLFDALTPKFVFAENVRQVLDYVGRGEVQAGFVYMTDALIAQEKVKVAAEMTGHAPIAYPVAILSAAKQKKEAGEFIAYLRSAEGQAILAKYGFNPGNAPHRATN